MASVLVHLIVVILSTHLLGCESYTLIASDKSLGKVELIAKNKTEDGDQSKHSAVTESKDGVPENDLKFHGHSEKNSTLSVDEDSKEEDSDRMLTKEKKHHKSLEITESKDGIPENDLKFQENLVDDDFKAEESGRVLTKEKKHHKSLEITGKDETSESGKFKVSDIDLLANLTNDDLQLNQSRGDSNRVERNANPSDDIVNSDKSFSVKLNDFYLIKSPNHTIIDLTSSHVSKSGPVMREAIKNKYNLSPGLSNISAITILVDTPDLSKSSRIENDDESKIAARSASLDIELSQLKNIGTSLEDVINDGNLNNKENCSTFLAKNLEGAIPKYVLHSASASPHGIDINDNQLFLDENYSEELSEITPISTSIPQYFKVCSPLPESDLFKFISSLKANHQRKVVSEKYIKKSSENTGTALEDAMKTGHLEKGENCFNFLTKSLEGMIPKYILNSASATPLGIDVKESLLINEEEYLKNLPKRLPPFAAVPQYFKICSVLTQSELLKFLISLRIKHLHAHHTVNSDESGEQLDKKSDKDVDNVDNMDDDDNNKHQIIDKEEDVVSNNSHQIIDKEEDDVSNNSHQINDKEEDDVSNNSHQIIDKEEYDINDDINASLLDGDIPEVTDYSAMISDDENYLSDIEAFNGANKDNETHNDGV